MAVTFKNLRNLAIAVMLSGSLAWAAPDAQSAKPANKVPKSAHHASKKSRKGRVRGQKAIDGNRVREIQEALIREHYLKVKPSGKWDDATQQAMHRYQSDQGWQSKSIPDSRALIRLGLGPDSEHLLNPESAMTMSTEPVTRRGSSRPPAKLSSVSMSTETRDPGPTGSGQESTPAANMPAVPTR
jgi:peptidoglycan hydrolase-like protein with peptidoglycan-binding domain